PREPEIPAAVKPYYEQRTGYANYWFNRYHQQRVWNAFLARGDFAETGWNWKVHARLAAGGAVQIELSEKGGAITMPEGRSEAEFKDSLTEAISPPRSGGLLPALHLWQRLLLVGPRRFGDVYYVGAIPWTSDAELTDCLSASYGGIDTQFHFDPAKGDLVGISMQASDDQDPCEIRFSEFREVEGRTLPHHWIVRHGDDVFADLTITSWERPAEEANKRD
ncbi:MAG: serine protease, partial [Pirellulales bacterium]